MTYEPRTPPPPPNALDLSGERSTHRRRDEGGGGGGGARGIAIWLVVVIAASCLGVGVISGYMLGFVSGSQLFEDLGGWEESYVELDYIAVTLDSPETISADTPFVVTLTVTNTDVVEHTLACVDVYFESAEVLSVDPAYIEMAYDEPGFKSYRYNTTLAPGDSVTTTIALKATATGEQYIDVDACIDDEETCVNRYFDLTVTSK